MLSICTMQFNSEGEKKYAYHSSPVDFKVTARDLELEAFVFRTGQVFEDVLGGQGVDAVLWVLSFAVKLTAHGVSLTRARLAVSEAGGHTALENILHQRSRCILVNQFICGGFVKYGIKAKMLVVQIFCQVHFGFRLMSNHLEQQKK